MKRTEINWVVKVNEDREYQEEQKTIKNSQRLFLEMGYHDNKSIFRKNE